jgi:hypothetical protein
MEIILSAAYVSLIFLLSFVKNTMNTIKRQMSNWQNLEISMTKKELIFWGSGNSSVVQSLPSAHEATGSNPQHRTHSYTQKESIHLANKKAFIVL